MAGPARKAGFGLALALGVSLPASAQMFSAGDVVVTLYGNVANSGATGTYLDGQDTPITLKEFSSTIAPGADSGAPVIAPYTLPTSGMNGNVGIVGEYGSSSEGTIQVSGDGRYLTLGGYDGNLDEQGAPQGGYGGNNTPLAQSDSSDVPRVAALIDISTGSVNTKTVLDDIYSTNNARSIYSPDGSNLYLSGQAVGVGDEGGLYYTPVGDNTTAGGSAPTLIFNAVSTRTVSESTVNATTGTVSTAPNLYYSADQNSKSKGTQTGIFEYSGTPTSTQGSNTGIRITLASGTVNGQAVNFSPQGFFFANATTLYVADTGDPKAGGKGDGGIQKWSFSSAGQAWTLDYTLKPSFAVGSTESGFEAIAGQVVNGLVDLYAVSYTTTDNAPDGLYGVTDVLSNTTAAQAAGETVVQLAASAPDQGLQRRCRHSRRRAGTLDLGPAGLRRGGARAPAPPRPAQLV